MLCSKWICNKLDNSFPASCKGDISSLQLFAINILPQWIQFYYLQHDFQTWDWLRLLVLKMHVLIIKWILPKKMSIWLYCAWRLVFFIRNVTSNQPNFANSMTLTHKWVHLQDILSCFKMHMPQRHIWKKEDIKPPIIFNLDSRWRWVVNVPAALPHYPLNRRHSQPHGTTGCFGEETNLFPLQGFELRFLGRPLRNLFSILSRLSQLPLDYCIYKILRSGVRLVGTSATVVTRTF